MNVTLHKPTLLVLDVIITEDNMRPLYELREMSAGNVASRDLDTRFKIKGGRVWYESARFTRRGHWVRVSRLKQGQTAEDGLRQINRYIAPHARVMVEMNETAIMQMEGV